MNLVVLGNNSPFPGKDSACSGYLVQNGEIELLLDLGTGVSGKFLQVSQVENLSGILISHLHPDHCSDLIPLKYAIQYAEVTGTRQMKVPVWMPTKPELDYSYLTGTVKNGYELHELNAETRFSLGELSLSFHQTVHSFPCYAMSVSNGRKRLVYTGDTGADPGLVEFAKGADLLLAECSIMADDPIRGNYTHVHLTPEMAAGLARDAEVKLLVLTHLWPYTPTTILLEKARSIFPAVEVAEVGKVYTI